jgi:four helix bundle protein
MSSKGFIPPHGGYQDLLSYQRSVVVYDATVAFCRDFFRKYDRTIDQMVQAARSGKQNIIEGSMASGTSKETELKLTNVARASLEELLEDYRDFLRTKQAKEWDKNSKEALFVRRLASGKIQLAEDGTKATPTPRNKPPSAPVWFPNSGLPSPSCKKPSAFFKAPKPHSKPSPMPAKITSPFAL